MAGEESICGVVELATESDLGRKRLVRPAKWQERPSRVCGPWFELRIAHRIDEVTRRSRLRGYCEETRDVACEVAEFAGAVMVQSDTDTIECTRYARSARRSQYGLTNNRPSSVPPSLHIKVHLPGRHLALHRIRPAH
jgi:hypothetical protein